MKLTIIGASGQGKVVANIASLCGYDSIDFLDDNETIRDCGGYPVVGNSYAARDINNDLFIAIGHAKTRKMLMEKYKDKNIPTLIHPSAVLAKDVIIGNGSVVMAGVVINPGTKIGKGSIINTSSSIDHDCVIEDYCHISVGVRLCGNVKVGRMVWIGAGSTISNNINICDKCTIGAGAVVINEIKYPGTYVGVPAHIIPVQTQTV